MPRPLRPPALLIATAALAAFLVQTGHLGNVDAARRLQVARSFWTSEPPVVVDGTGFGIPGRSGRMEAWYGAGQSLVFLPFDVAAEGLLSASPKLRSVDERLGGVVRRGFVAYGVAILVCILTVSVAYRLLLTLRFNGAESLWGSLSLLLATTFLHYTQVLQENGLLLLLMLSGAYFHLRWARGGGGRNLVAGLACLSFGVLTRLTATIDFVVIVAFVTACLWRGGAETRRVAKYLGACATGGAVALALDRAYHFARFGTLTDTYISRFGDFWKATHPGTPHNFPFSTPFWEGFLGPLVSAEKSVFLYDPLLLLTLYLAVRFRSRLGFEVKAFVAAQCGLLLAYVCFYARYFDWSGDSAWGDRFVTAPVQAVCLVGGAVLARHVGELGRAKLPALAIVAFAAALQVSSVVFSYNLERIQLASRPESARFIIGLRAENIVAGVTGNTEAWGLAEGVPERELTPNLTPFGPARDLPPPLGALTLAVWIAGLVVFTAALFSCTRLRHDLIPLEHPPARRSAIVD